MSQNKEETTTVDNNIEEDNSSDISDLELIQICSREDLFNLLKENPKYYLDLIEKNKLCHPLNILIKRHEDGGGLNIKFKMYPNDRWIEVGYWGDDDDFNIYEEFTNQVKIMLAQRVDEKRLGRSSCDNRSHLACELEGNNNMLSENYGSDITNFNKKSNLQTISFDNNNMNDLEKRLLNSQNNIGNINKIGKKTSEKRGNQFKTSSLLSHSENLNLKDEIEDNMNKMLTKPMDFLNNYIASLIEKIIENLHTMMVSQHDRSEELDERFNTLLSSIECLESMSDDAVPSQYQECHDQLKREFNGLRYVNRMNGIFMEYPNLEEIKPYLTNFYRQSLKLNPGIYLNLTQEQLETVLDDLDREIIDKYSLNIKSIWTDHLKHLD